MIEEGKVKDLRSQVLRIFENPAISFKQKTCGKCCLTAGRAFNGFRHSFVGIQDSLVYKHGMENRLINSDKKILLKILLHLMKITYFLTR